MDSNLKTTKTASAKHHPGSEAWREERKEVQRAPCAGCTSETCTDSKDGISATQVQRELCSVCASENCTDSKDENSPTLGILFRRWEIDLNNSANFHYEFHKESKVNLFFGDFFNNNKNALAFGKALRKDRDGSAEKGTTEITNFFCNFVATLAELVKLDET